MNTMPVSEGTRVFLNFSLSLDDGSEVDTNFGGDPVDFGIGGREMRALLASSTRRGPACGTSDALWAPCREHRWQW